MEILIIIFATIIFFIITYKIDKNNNFKKIVNPLFASLSMFILGLFRFNYISTDVCMLLILLILIMFFLIEYVPTKK